jgi:hypothetical protein
MMAADATARAESSDTVGRYLMVQAGNVILGRFEEPARMYKAPPAHAMTEEFYETDRTRDFSHGLRSRLLARFRSRLRSI